LGLVKAQTKLRHKVSTVTLGQSLSPILKADVVHLHGVWEPLLYKASRLALKHNIPYLVTPHGMLNVQHSLSQKRYIKKFLLATYIKKILNQAQAIHLLNQAEKRSVAPLNLSSKISIIPNAVNLSLKKLTKSPQLPNRPYFIFLGRLFHKKGTSLLIQAFSQFKQLAPLSGHHLVVAGPNAGALKDMKNQVSKLGLTSVIHFTGLLDDQTKLQALAHSTAFILPSHQEGFSIAVLEALSVSTPVIISKQTNFPEVKTSNSGLVLSLKSTLFAQAMNKLASRPSYAKKLGQNGRQLVVKHYTWEKVAKQMISLYKTL